MIQEVTITIKPNEEKDQKLIKKLIIRQLNAKNTNEEITPVFVKKSVDARHGQVKYHLRYKVYIGETPDKSDTSIPEWKKADGKKSVIIIGSGPAGLFGALRLLEEGIKPIIIERGVETTQRRKDIALISTQDYVNENSNYCFGEGGAGTFSDGKLYTRSDKRGDIHKIHRIFTHFGADPKITTDAHPHIGTDKLPKVINAMRDKIIELGGEVHFGTKFIDMNLDGNNLESIIVQEVASGIKKTIKADAVLLATGHSAPDVYNLIAKKMPQALEAKTFAVGVRVEHPRKLIDDIQYHKKTEGLPAAEYRVVAQAEDRGVYSFCMCPGGFVIPSSSGPEEIVVNGMSAAARNSKWSNAAIVVETRPEDIPEDFKNQAKNTGCPDLAGLFYRTYLEKLAYKNGKGQAAPAQRLTDFLANRKSKDLPASSYTPGLVSSNLNDWLPEALSGRLAIGFKEFNKKMQGYITSDALMIAIETRTSTPVRICRNKDNFECTCIKGLYPAGEGSGYSGGIVSSAMDGENACSQIINALKKQESIL